MTKTALASAILADGGSVEVDLKTIGTWSSDDLQDSLETVQNLRGKAQFD